MFTAKTTSTKAHKPESQHVAMTFISLGSEVQGDLVVAGNLRVEGMVRGNVRAEGDIEISASGVIEGQTVAARNILIHGRVKATISANGQLRIHSQGEVEGDVTAESLDIESGARFVGYSHTGIKHSADIISMEKKS